MHARYFTHHDLAALVAIQALGASQTEPLALRFVTDAMGMWMAYQGQWKKSRWGVASNHLPELASDLEK